MKSFFILFFVCITAIAFPQDSRSSHYIGIHAGSTTAYGLSYRFWPNKLGLEFTTLPTFQKIPPTNKNLINSTISTGLSILYKIKENKIVDLYAYVGGFTLFKKTHTAEYEGGSYQTIYIKHEQLDLNLGLGIGTRFKFLEVMDFNLQLGYGMYKINQPNQFYSQVAGEVGLYYNF